MADLLALSARFIDEGIYEGPGSVNRVTAELSEVADGVAVVEAFSHVVVFSTHEGLVLFDTSLEAFAGRILASLRGSDSEFAADTLKTLGRNSPLSVACTLEMMRRLKGNTDIRAALALEYRYTFRAMEHGDFLEGIRAAIIDKDRSPNWRHTLDDLPAGAVQDMLAPLGDNELTF